MFKILRHFSLTSAVAILAFVIASVPARAEAAEVISGPITADVVRVYEGDTLIVHAHPWPNISIHIRVRVAGVDTPEKRGKCDAEKALAIKARDYARGVVGKEVLLTDIRPGRYARRVVADVWVGGEKLLSTLLIENGHGRPFSGPKDRKSWC